MDLISLIGHLSFVAIAASFLVRDILWLRIVSIFGSLLAVLFNYWVEGGPIWLVIWWSLAFILINAYNIYALLRERRGVSFSPEEQEIYATVFQGFSPVEFMKLLRIGRWMEVDAGEVLIEQGQPVAEVLFIYNGQAEVLSDGQKVNALKDGAFIGEMELAKGTAAVATVKTVTQVRLLSWPADEIRSLLVRNPTMNSTIQTIFSADLMQKLQRQTSGVT
jgi:hypothetical protein